MSYTPPPIVTCPACGSRHPRVDGCGDYCPNECGPTEPTGYLEVREPFQWQYDEPEPMLLEVE